MLFIKLYGCFRLRNMIENKFLYDLHTNGIAGVAT